MTLVGMLMETKLMWGEGVDFVIYERPLMEKSPDRVSWIASMREKEPVTITQALKLKSKILCDFS